MLATLYFKQGLYDRAKELYERAGQGYTSTCGAEHPHTHMAHQSLELVINKMQELIMDKLQEHAALQLPASLLDTRHGHGLQLTENVYQGRGFKCDGCGLGGRQWCFHCDACGFDLHPKCVSRVD